MNRSVAVEDRESQQWLKNTDMVRIIERLNKRNTKREKDEELRILLFALGCLGDLEISDVVMVRIDSLKNQYQR